MPLVGLEEITANVAGVEEDAGEEWGEAHWEPLVGLGQSLAFAPSEVGANARFGPRE